MTFAERQLNGEIQAWALWLAAESERARTHTHQPSEPHSSLPLPIYQPAVDPSLVMFSDKEKQEEITQVPTGCKSLVHGNEILSPCPLLAS